MSWDSLQIWHFLFRHSRVWTCSRMVPGPCRICTRGHKIEQPQSDPFRLKQLTCIPPKSLLLRHELVVPVLSSYFLLLSLFCCGLHYLYAPLLPLSHEIQMRVMMGRAGEFRLTRRRGMFVVVMMMTMTTGAIPWKRRRIPSRGQW